MNATFEFIAHSGKRQYELWLNFENYHSRFTIRGNTITIRGVGVEINKNSHKDWGKAFTFYSSDECETIVEFKKGAPSLQIDTINKWIDGRHLIMIEGSSI